MQEKELKPKTKKGLIIGLSTLAGVATATAVVVPTVLATQCELDFESKKAHEIIIPQTTVEGYKVSVDPTTAKRGEKVKFSCTTNNSTPSNETMVPKAIRITTIPKSGDPVSSEYLLYKTDNDTFETEVTIEFTSNMKAELVFETLSDYVVTFDINGGDIATQPQTQYIQRGKKVADPGSRTRTGYDFDGWYAEGESFPFNFETRVIEGNTTLKAQWNVHKWKVDWKNCDGTILETDPEVPYGETPTYDGNTPQYIDQTGQYKYTFIGWDKAIQPMPDKNVEYVAKYDKTENKYTATFDSNGGSFVSSQVVLWNTKLSEPQVYLEGYKLLGWKRSDTGSYWNFYTDTLKTDITLTAEWEKDEFTVEFDPAGGSGVSSVTKKYGETINEEPKTTRDGFTFAGWYYDGKLVSFPYTIKKNVTLTAKWNEAYVTVTFNSNGGTDVPSQQVQKDIGVATKPTNPTKTGYTFQYWYGDSEATPWNFAADHFTANKTLNAKWEINKYTVTFDSNGGSSVSPISNVEHGSTITKPTDPTFTHYTFDGWYDGNTEWDFAAMTVTKDLTLKAHWTQDATYTVTFDTNGGSSVESKTVWKGETVSQPTSPSKTGYTFDGWYSDKELTTTFNFGTQIEKDTTIYAKWTPIQYTVSYLDKGGSAFTGDHETSYAQTHTYGTDTALDTPSRQGYTFKGYYTDSACTGTVVSKLGKNDYTSNITLYAKWEQITVTGIQITTYPTKTTYYKQTGTVTQSLDLTDMKVNVIKSDGSSEEKTPDLQQTTIWAATGFNVSTTGEKTITLTYTDTVSATSYPAQFKINVVDQYKKLIIKNQATNTTFYQNQTFEAANLQVALVDYENNEVEADSITSGTTFENDKYTISGSTATLGMQPVTITHTNSGMTATYYINVVNQYKSLDIITYPTQLECTTNDQFDPTGLEVQLQDYKGDPTTAKYGTTAWTQAGLQISGATVGQTMTAGTHAIKIYKGALSTSYTVKVTQVTTTITPQFSLDQLTATAVEDLTVTFNPATIEIGATSVSISWEGTLSQSQQLRISVQIDGSGTIVATEIKQGTSQPGGNATLTWADGAQSSVTVYLEIA